ncbi:MAG: hypothetical protein J7K00_04550 [Candidatus Diapherotrites archaeon]|nr:hypothetical protein [Candidatus Diapherotrites archaeon]
MKKNNFKKPVLAGLLILSFLLGAFAVYGALNINPLLKGSKTVSVQVPAVSDMAFLGGKATVVKINVTAVPGSGKMFFDATKSKIDSSIQQSFKDAVTFINPKTNFFFGNHDLYIHIESEASLAKGPSAGLPIGLAIYCLAENKKIREGYFASGTISDIGKIEKVQKILEKAHAVRNIGGKVLVVSEFHTPTEKEELQKINGLKVKFVSDLDDAIDIMIE